MTASWAAKTVPKQPKSPQEQPKTPSRPPKSPPRPSKEGPRAPKSGPRPAQDGPKAAQDGSWGHLGTNESQDRKQDAIRTVHPKSVEKFEVDFGSQNGSQNDLKSSPKRVKINTKNASLFYRSWTRLRPVLGRSWAHLGSIFGHFVSFFSTVF